MVPWTRGLVLSRKASAYPTITLLSVLKTHIPNLQFVTEGGSAEITTNATLLLLLRLVLVLR
jgi:hypothetical protein